jgi:xylulokinase
METHIRPLLLGIDAGTSGLKAVLLDEAGLTVAEATAAYELRSPQPGWAEQDPDEWWAALRTALAELWQRGIDPARIASIGLTGQMHSLAVLDKDGDVLCPALLWCDQRTGAECVEITERIGAANLLERTGNLAMAGFTAPKILWIRRNWPDVFARAAHLLVTKDFIRYRLTGDVVGEMSDASGMLLLDVRERRWADDIIDELGIAKSLLPALVEGNEVTGRIHAAAAAWTGLVEGTPVVAGAGDNAAAAVGLGALDPGVVTLSIGTSGVIFAPLDRYPSVVDGRLHVFCHALPGRWHLMSVTMAAGGSLHWFRDMIAPLLPVQGDSGYEWLTERAGRAAPGAGGVVFLPYLSGERTPHADPNARGVFYGLHMSTGLDEMARAVLEGVAFSQRQGLDLMREAGAATTVARGAGGGLSSPLWRQILADALGVGLQLAGPGMGAARGAAILGGLGVGLYSTPEVGMDWAAEPIQAPSEAGARALEEPFSVYKALYPRLQPVFDAPAWPAPTRDVDA